MMKTLIKKQQRSGQALRLNPQSGQAMMITTIFFVLISLLVIFGLTEVVTRQLRTARLLSLSQGSYLVAEASAEDVVYRLKTGKNVATTETLTINNYTATTTVSDVSEGKEIIAEAEIDNNIRLAKIVVTEGSGASFFYGVQTGNGGFDIQNTASVKGNVFSNGPVTGANSNIIYGDVISAGASGLIDGIHATGSAYAHTISDSDIDKDAYYQSISGTTVDGNSYPGSADQEALPLPIGDSLVEEWKTEAEAGGVIDSPCTYKIEDDITIGPIKIDCDLEISGNNFTVTLTGHIWVAGDIIIKNSPTIEVDSSLSNQSVAIIAHDESDSTGSGKIELQNSVVFAGAGPNSHVLLLSMNDSAENSGSEVAIDVKNSVQGDLLVYAGHGLIEIQNSVQLKEVTAHTIRIKNSAQVIYESGLSNLLFTSGPGGGYVVQKWKEI